MQKRIKGSAILTDDNDFLFTPYRERSADDDPWKLVVVNANGSLRRSARVITLRATLPVGTSRPLQEFVKITYNFVAKIESEQVALFDTPKSARKRE